MTDDARRPGGRRGRRRGLCRGDDPRPRRHVQHVPAADGGAFGLPRHPRRPAGLGPFAAPDRAAVDRDDERGGRSRAWTALASTRRISSAIRWARMVCQHIAVDAAAHGRVADAVRRAGRADRGDAQRACKAAPRLARAGGMADIADQIVANALSAHTRETSPAAVAFVRESIMRQDPEAYARTCEALAKATAVDARGIAAPTLLVTGDADTVNPVSVAQALADKIKGARIVLAWTAAAIGLLSKNRRRQPASSRISCSGSTGEDSELRGNGAFAHRLGGIHGWQTQTAGTATARAARCSPMCACSMRPANIPTPARCWCRATASSRSPRARRASARLAPAAPAARPSSTAWARR